MWLPSAVVAFTPREWIDTIDTANYGGSRQTTMDTANYGGYDKLRWFSAVVARSHSNSLSSHTLSSFSTHSSLGVIIYILSPDSSSSRYHAQVYQPHFSVLCSAQCALGLKVLAQGLLALMLVLTAMMVLTSLTLRTFNNIDSTNDVLTIWKTLMVLTVIK